MAGLCEALSLLFGCHGNYLRAISSSHGKHYIGLGVAARRACKHGHISMAMRSKLLQLDAAYNVSRHITQASADRLALDLQAILESVPLVDMADSKADTNANPIGLR